MKTAIDPIRERLGAELHDPKRAHIHDLNKLLTAIAKVLDAAKPILEYDTAGNPVRECMFCGGDTNCAPGCEINALLETSMDVLLPPKFQAESAEEPSA